jgi:glycosyltransferase involved in cell wall biosynthesis
MAVYNEADIIAQCLQYHIGAGLEFLVLDNGSSDDSLSIAEGYLGRGVLGIRRITTETYRWAYLLDTLLEWSEDFEAKWCFLVDADTFLEAPSSEVTLAAGVREVELQGYNVINFDHFEFWPVGDERPEELDVRARIKYYTWADDRQQKGWRALRSTRNSRLGGHAVDLPSGIPKLVFPHNFVLRHYRIRSYEHGLRKVFADRLPRFAGEPANWHTHYDGFGSDRKFFEIPKSCLTKRIEGEPWNRELRFHGWETKRILGRSENLTQSGLRLPEERSSYPESQLDVLQIDPPDQASKP